MKQETKQDATPGVQNENNLNPPNRSEISRRKVLAGLAVAPLVGGIITSAGGQSDKVLKAMSPREKLQARYFPNFQLTTHEGRKVWFYDDLIKGKIVAIDLIYTTCQYSCPLETARLAQVHQQLQSLHQQIRNLMGSEGDDSSDQPN